MKKSAGAAKAQSRSRSPARTPQPEPGLCPEDRVDGELRAYLASIHFMDGLAFGGEDLDALVHGRDLVERLAQSAADTGGYRPSLVLTVDEAADVLAFMQVSDAVDRRTWYTEPDAGPSHISGFYHVLNALERALRGGKEALS